MKSRQALSLRWPLFLWNFSLALFSILGFVRFTEDLAVSLLTHGFYKSLCYSCEPRGVAAFWAFLFALSKVGPFFLCSCRSWNWAIPCSLF